MLIMVRDRSRLPQWVQDELKHKDEQISQLGQQLQELAAVAQASILDEMRGSSTAITLGGTAFPHSHLCLPIGDGHGAFEFLRVAIQENRVGDRVLILDYSGTGGDLVVRPKAANSLVLCIDYVKDNRI